MLTLNSFICQALNKRCRSIIPLGLHENPIISLTLWKRELKLGKGLCSRSQGKYRADSCTVRLQSWDLHLHTAWLPHRRNLASPCKGSEDCRNLENVLSSAPFLCEWHEAPLRRHSVKNCAWDPNDCPTWGEGDAVFETQRHHVWIRGNNTYFITCLKVINTVPAIAAGITASISYDVKLCLDNLLQNVSWNE